jgi:hypothetical protein
VIGDTYGNRKLVAKFLGSAGLGNEGGSLIDFTPAAAPFWGDEAGRKMGSGHPLGGLADLALAAIPVPAVVKGGRGLLGASAREAVKPVAEAVERAAPATYYHGRSRHDLTSLAPQRRDGTFDFPPVVSLSTDKKHAAGYAGPTGRVYEANVLTDKVGDFRDPKHAAEAMEFFRKKYGDLDKYDVEAIQHGAWRFWEDPDLWNHREWDGAFVREEPGRSDAHILNLSLRSGDKVKLKP